MVASAMVVRPKQKVGLHIAMISFHKVARVAMV